MPPELMRKKLLSFQTGICAGMKTTTPFSSVFTKKLRFFFLLPLAFISMVCFSEDLSETASYERPALSLTDSDFSHDEIGTLFAEASSMHWTHGLQCKTSMAITLLRPVNSLHILKDIWEDIWEGIIVTEEVMKT